MYKFDTIIIRIYTYIAAVMCSCICNVVAQLVFQWIALSFRNSALRSLSSVTCFSLMQVL